MATSTPFDYRAAVSDAKASRDDSMGKIADHIRGAGVEAHVVRIRCETLSYGSRAVEARQLADKMQALLAEAEALAFRIADDDAARDAMAYKDRTAQRFADARRGR